MLSAENMVLSADNKELSTCNIVLTADNTTYVINW
jgi:hypothetical protein